MNKRRRFKVKARRASLRRGREWLGVWNSRAWRHNHEMRVVDALYRCDYIGMFRFADDRHLTTTS